MLKNTTGHFGLVTKLFHAIIGGLIIYLMYLGATMGDLPNSDAKWATYATHKSLGMIVLGSTLLFYIWRIFNVKPDDAPTLIRGQLLLSKIVKFGLLLVMALFPLSGYLMSSTGGHAVKVFDWYNVPLLLDKNEELQHLFHEVHESLLPITIVLLLLHIAGTLHHKFVLKDDTLEKITTKFKD